jgi:hypothetical protein
VPHRLKPVACVDGPATGCRSLYDPISRLCRRAAMLITPGHPVCRSFAVSRLGSFMFQISPNHASGSSRPNRIAFRRHSWSFADRLASLEASSRLATARFSSIGLLPYAVHLGFPAGFRRPFHRTSDLRARRLWRLIPSTAELTCAVSATLRSSTSHSSLKMPSGLRLAPLSIASLRSSLNCTDEAVCLPSNLAVSRR